MGREHGGQSPEEMGFSDKDKKMAGLEAARSKTERKAEAEANRRRNVLEKGQKIALGPKAISEKAQALRESGMFSRNESDERMRGRAYNSAKRAYQEERKSITPQSVLHEEALRENRQRDEHAIEETRKELEKLYDQQATERNASLTGRVKKFLGQKSLTGVDVAHGDALEEEKRRKS